MEKLKYFSIKKKDEVNRLSSNLDVEFGLHNLYPLGSPYKLGGTYRVLQLKSQIKNTIIKIEGPQEVLNHFIETVGSKFGSGVNKSS